MSSFNKVIVMGNLTRTPELRTTPGGAQVTDITLAVNDKYKDGQGNWQERTTFVDITVWGKQAETLCRWKKQGDALLVEGRLQQDKWVDKETGKNRTKLKVVANNFSFVGRGGGDGGGGNGGNRNNQGNQGGYNNGGGGGGYSNDSYQGEEQYADSLPGGGEEPPF